MFDKFVNAEKALCEENSPQEVPSIEKIKETIYKTYTKTLNNSIELQKESKGRMKSILDLLIYTQMKKIEMKLEYFNEFEKLLEYESSSLKTMETHIIQDRVKFAIRRIELQDQLEKIKQTQNSDGKLINKNNNSDRKRSNSLHLNGDELIK